MAIEESSVVAAAANASFWLEEEDLNQPLFQPQSGSCSFCLVW